MPDTTRPASIDAMLEAIADRRRREVLHALRRVDGGVSLEKLAGDIAGSASASGSSVEQTTVSLCHHHLPKLAECDIVTWDRTDDEVRPGTAFETAESLLLSLQEHSEALSADTPPESEPNPS